MNGYGTIEKIFRPLGIGIIKNKEGERIIFTAPAVKKGADGFDNLTEGDEVHYKVFNEEVGNMKIARDVWPKAP